MRELARAYHREYENKKVVNKYKLDENNEPILRKVD